MKHLLAVAVIVGLGMSASVQALDCNKAVTTPEMNECAAIDQKKVEIRLNQTYQRVMKSLGGSDAETRKKLIEAQRAWIKFREADCAAVYQQHVGGTIRGLMYSGCMQSRAEQRIKELKQFMEP